MSATSSRLRDPLVLVELYVVANFLNPFPTNALLHGRRRDLAKIDENTGFHCLNCEAYVEPVTNGSFRNHCPFCLWSRHVDGIRPGDRMSSCGAPMKPIGLTRKKKGLQIVHACTCCGKSQPNKVAFNTIQDDFEAILAFMAHESG